VSGRLPLIRLRFGRYRFQASLWPTLATFALFPCLIALGNWQLSRAETKRILQASYDRYQSEPEKELYPVLESLESLQFRRIRVRGQYVPEKQILLDNRVHLGRAGYHVLTPLRIRDGNVHVLVNRGWVPVGPDRSKLPPAASPPGEVEITGVATQPSRPGFRLAAAQPPGPGWHTVWQYLDQAEYARASKYTLQPVVILLDPEAPGGFARQWSRLDAGIQTHLGYALTWFSLAIALIAIYILVNTRREDDVENP